MKHLFLTLCIIALLAPGAPLRAASEPSPFNPDFIISDETLQAWQSMSLEDIQVFLEQNGSALARMMFPDVNGAMRRASDIVFQAARTHGINPKYILVKLQKEQSLITDGTPTQKQLDWAAGYGICDSCSMSDPAVQKHRGFGTQVDAAGGIMRWYYNNAAISPIVKRPNTAYVIDSTLIRPVNFATAFLYTYTPHIHGNKNFWLLWEKWFEQVYPDGTLAKAPDASTVYLIRGGEKRAFATMTALVSRFDPSRVLTLPKAELDAYATGSPIALPNYSILKSGDAYYLLDFDILRPFADATTVAKLGFNPDEIIDVAPQDIADLTIGTPIRAEARDPVGRIVRVEENNSLYYLQNDTYAFISDAAVAKNRFPQLAIVQVSAKTLESYAPAAAPILFGDGVLFGIRGDNKIYVTEHGRKRHIPTEAVFNALGYSWKNVVWVDQFTGLNYPTGAPMSPPRSTLIASAGDSPVPTAGLVPSSAMVDTPDEKTVYVGTRFDTPVDAYLVADAQTGTVLAGKNIDIVRPMASFAKVMTAYRLLKEGVSLSRSSTYDPSRYSVLYPNFRIASGEKILNEHLFYAFLVSSLNTPGNMLVNSIEKSPSAFVARMNTQAKDWGLAHTMFADVNGEDVATETTARDYLALFRKSTDNIDLRRVMGLSSYRYTELLDLDGNPLHYDNNSNDLMEKSGLPFRIIASKTGYLDEAGSGLAMLIERVSDKKQFILITMGNPDSMRKFDEPERLARWAMTAL
jgi:D-alanyl-D-alanine carboxypeptidase